MNRIYGEKYNPRLSVNEIAKQVKKEIKNKYPGIKVSATSRDYEVINIRVWLPQEHFRAFTIEDLPQGVFSHVAFMAERGGKTVLAFLQDNIFLNKEVYAIVSDIHNMLNAYNYDGSDVMTDYFDKNFYGFVDVELV